MRARWTWALAVALWACSDASQEVSEASGYGRRSTGSTPLPCALQSVLHGSCQSCHASEPGPLAPMALVTLEDLMAPAVSRPTRTVQELVLERVQSELSPMPPSPGRRLTRDEIASLSSVAAGACAEDSPIAYPAPAPAEIDHCYPLLAHSVARAGDATPYLVPTGESHACFMFDVPWTGEAQAISVRARQSATVHHWLLSDQTGAFADGQIVRDVRDCNFGAQRVYAVSAINQQSELNMPPGIGLRMPGAGAQLMLAMHYFNNGEPVEDASGVEVCVPTVPRAQTASVVELGGTFFALPPHADTTVSSTCTPRHDGDIHILRVFPHMHARGVRLDTKIRRASGAVETLIDKPFDFNSQIAYDVAATVKSADQLITSCHYINTTSHTVFSGESTDDEMCINFVTAWPADGLARAVAGEAESCPQ